MDFLSYYTGATMIRDGSGNRLYNMNAQLATQKDILNKSSIKLLPFLVLPFVGLLFIPFTYLLYPDAYLVFGFLNIILLIFIIFIEKKVFINLKNLTILGLLTFMYIPNLHSLLFGQLSIALSLIFLLIYMSIKDKKAFITGFLSGLILLKPQYVIAVPFLMLLLDKKQSFIAGLSISFAIILFINLVIVGPNELSTYLKFISITETQEYMDS